MKQQNVYNSLDEAVTVGLACVKEGLETQAAVKGSIMQYVAANFLPVAHVKALGDIPIWMLDMLHAQLDIAFEVNDGRISRAVLEPAPMV